MLTLPTEQEQKVPEEFPKAGIVGTPHGILAVPRAPLLSSPRALNTPKFEFLELPELRISQGV